MNARARTTACATTCLSYGVKGRVRIDPCPLLELLELLELLLLPLLVAEASLSVRRSNVKGLASSCWMMLAEASAPFGRVEEMA